MRNLDLDALENVSGGLSLKSTQMQFQGQGVNTGLPGDPYGASPLLGQSPLLGASPLGSPLTGPSYLQPSLQPSLNPGLAGSGYYADPYAATLNPSLVSPSLLQSGLGADPLQSLLLQQQLGAAQPSSGLSAALPAILGALSNGNIGNLLSSLLGQSGLMGQSQSPMGQSPMGQGMDPMGQGMEPGMGPNQGMDPMGQGMEQGMEPGMDQQGAMG